MTWYAGQGLATQQQQQHKPSKHATAKQKPVVTAKAVADRGRGG
jgi:hypothetical protein